MDGVRGTWDDEEEEDEDEVEDEQEGDGEKVEEEGDEGLKKKTKTKTKKKKKKKTMRKGSGGGGGSRGAVVILAATDRRDQLDDAILRPGRLDQQIEMSLPSADERRKILFRYMSAMPVGAAADVSAEKTETVGEVGKLPFAIDANVAPGAPDVFVFGSGGGAGGGTASSTSSLFTFGGNAADAAEGGGGGGDAGGGGVFGSGSGSLLSELVWRTDGCSGAQLEDLCREAAMHALRRDIASERVLEADFLAALRAVRGSGERSS